MPKTKTNKGAAKRFKVTGKGRLKRRQANKSHILTKKAPGRKRRLGKAEMVAKADESRIKRLLGR